MYHSWLDCWDERRAQRGEEAKNAKDFSLNAELAFPGAGGSKVSTSSVFLPIRP